MAGEYELYRETALPSQLQSCFCVIYLICFYLKLRKVAADAAQRHIQTSCKINLALLLAVHTVDVFRRFCCSDTLWLRGITAHLPTNSCRQCQEETYVFINPAPIFHLLITQQQAHTLLDSVAHVRVKPVPSGTALRLLPCLCGRDG